jgi:hypothetical protein
VAFNFSLPPTARELIVRLEELGCVVRDLSGEIQIDDHRYVVRYVRNPENGRLWICSEYGDDERLSPSVVGSVERVLGLTTGFPSRRRRDQS